MNVEGLMTEEKTEGNRDRRMRNKSFLAAQAPLLHISSTIGRYGKA
jgi:hypothetical protein